MNICKKIFSLNSFLPRSVGKSPQLGLLEPCSQGEGGCTENTSHIYSLWVEVRLLRLLPIRGFGSLTRKTTLSPSLTENRQREFLCQDPLTPDPELDH